MQLFNEIEELGAPAEEDADKFYGDDNEAAGTRLRKAMMEVEKKAHALRQEVQARTNEM